MKTALALSSILLFATACSSQAADSSLVCHDAKCDVLGDTQRPQDSECFASASTGAMRCTAPGLEGIARLIADGFDPVIPLSCEELNVVDPGDPASEATLFNVVIPICEYLPYCSFRGSASACVSSWQFVDTQEPEVQCALVDGADLSADAKAAYCAVDPCAGSQCETRCQSYRSQASGKVRCVGNSALALSELLADGEKPVLDMSCAAIDAMTTELEASMTHDEALVAMRDICDATPHCLFKESGSFCMPAWQIVGSVAPEEQCNLMQQASVTEAAKESYCNLAVEGACGGTDCTICEWIPAAEAGLPGACQAAAP